MINKLFNVKAPRRAFKVDLMLCFIGLIIFTFVIVIYNFTTNSRVTLELAKSLVNNVTKNAVNETTHYLKAPQEIPFFAAKLLTGYHLNLPKDAFLENHLMQAVTEHPEIFMYYVGDEKGNFLMSYRNRYGNISSQVINKEAAKPVATLKFRNDKGEIYAQKQQFDNLYDPRERPWYVNAKKNLKPHWTQTYSFYADDLDDIYTEENEHNALFGFTISNPILDNQHKLIGVMGIDISLNQLSDFLSALKIGSNGKAFIVDNTKHLILFPGVSNKQLVITDSYNGMLVNDIPIHWLKAGVEKFFKTHQTEFFYTFNGSDYFVKVQNLQLDMKKDWNLVIIVPVDDFLLKIKKTSSISFLITIVMLIVSIVFSFWFSRTLARPLEKMTENMRQIHKLNFAELQNLSSPIKEFQQMADALLSMTQGLKAFLMYVPSGVVKQLIKKGETISVGGDELDMTLFFSDIENFAKIAENTAPMELMADLSHYFDQMVKVIVTVNHGTIDKYIGDSVMAFWGAPTYTPDHAKLSCLAALACQDEIGKINTARIKQGKSPFTTRIGINTGVVIVGNIGSSDRYNYTVIGDNVNLASRIEGLNKIYGTGIIVSQSTYRQVQGFFVFRPLDFIMVKGKDEEIKIYQLLAKQGHCSEAILALVELATQAFDCYLAKEFNAALQFYQQIIANYPDDIPAKIMIGKCQNFIHNPPDANWTGATRIHEK